MGMGCSFAYGGYKGIFQGYFAFAEMTDLDF
jgi:hypothetical protein